MVSSKKLMIILTILILIGFVIISSYLFMGLGDKEEISNSDENKQLDENISVEVSPNGNIGYIKVNDLGDYEKVKVLHSKGFCKSSTIGRISHCLVEGDYRVKQYKNNSDKGEVIKSGRVDKEFTSKGDSEVPYEISTAFSDNYYKHSDYLIDISLIGPIQNRRFFDKVNMKATIQTPNLKYKNYKVNHSFGVLYRKFVNLDREGRYKVIITAENIEKQITLREEYNFYIEDTPIIVGDQTEIPSISRGATEDISLVLNGKEIVEKENINIRFTKPFKEGQSYDTFRITGDRNLKIEINEGETKSVNQTLTIPESMEPGVYKMPVYISIDNDVRYSDAILIRKIEFKVT